MIMYIKYTDPFSILYQPYTTPYTFHSNKYQKFSDFTVRIIAPFIVFYRITVRFILLYYGTCIGLGIELYLAIQLFSYSAASMLQ